MKPILEYNLEPYLEWILNCQLGERTEIEKMLESGYDINTTDDDGFSGLYHSIDEEQFDTALYLIKRGIELDIIDLKVACNKENREVVKRIIDDLKLVGKQSINEVFLDFVYSCSYEFLVWYVNEFSPNINHVENKELTAISEVATNGDLKKFKFLLECGADLNLKGNDGMNTIEWCEEVSENVGVQEIIKEIKISMNNV